jgi:hypothetical protein
LKQLTSQKICDILDDVIADEREKSRIKGQPVTGIPGDVVLNQLRVRIDDDWQLVKQNIQFTKEDVLAAVKARFLKDKGMTIILIMFATLLGIQALASFTLLSNTIVYVSDFLIIISFLYHFVREQKKAIAKMLDSSK